MSAGARMRAAFALCLAGCLVLAVALAPAAGAGKAKGKKRGGEKVRTFSTGDIDQPIPDAPNVPGVEGALASTLSVGKALKGRTITDVNVAVRATHTLISDLTFRLTAPNGATSFLVFGVNGTSLGAGSTDCNGGFTRFDDESPFKLGFLDPPSIGELPPPYAGTARPDGKPLAVMDGGPVRGVWTLRIRDFDQPNVGTLHCWQIQVRHRARGRSG